ncbi:hypothetical protein B9G98_01627 [Wickerhamiella sorbophila]|uniref:Ketoreductase domain-containing protein n=1 Tax=Wickerhamiella sorbophila TaxID=45607 RepID=A0A2T0FGB7_9ASCO|nr:hypothetical protein B9G98_01627 [Wickerhamiella sorbophila]PRT54007.1 hypothetical protein B9G98_01627 [Wickerhamiella sorbophila]
MSNVKGKVIVITGASSGLGLVAAREFAKLGAKVVVGARRLDRLNELVKELGQPEATAVKVDVTKREQVENLVQTALDIYGRIDVLVNNAGYMPLSYMEKCKVDEWDATIDINIKGVLYGVAAIIPVFKKQKSGQIINVSSVAGHNVLMGGAVYSASKYAVRAISEGLRQELKPYNVRVLNVSPGATESDLLQGITDEDINSRLANIQRVPATVFSDALIFAVNQPENVDINEIIFRPTSSVI